MSGNNREEGDRGWDALAARGLADGVVVADAVGTIRWINPAGAALLGRDPDDLVGASLFDLLSPEEQNLAGHAMALLDRAPGQVQPAIYHPIRHDGAVLPVEINASVTQSDEGPVLLLAVRRADHQLVLHSGISRLTQGEPFEQVVNDALDDLVGRWPAYRAALALNDHLQGPRCLGDLPGDVADLLVAGQGDTPWARAVTTGQIVFSPCDELPEPVATRAEAHGFRACLAVPLPDPSDLRPCLVLWAGLEAPYLLETFWADSPSFLLLTYAVQRHDHLARLEHAATTDSLTQLANRATFLARLDEVARREPLAVLYIDLDDFKPVNDHHGHGVGDQVLAEVSARMRHAVRPGDLLARLGGDELGVLCAGIATVDDAVTIADRLVEALREPIWVGDDAVRISASVGVALRALGDDEPVTGVVERADGALYEAKRAGKDRWSIAATA